MAEEDKPNLARYHKEKRIPFCSVVDAEEQKKCKYWEEASSYVPWNDHCEWWNRGYILEIEYNNQKCRYCRNIKAQDEVYAKPSLQVK